MARPKRVGGTTRLNLTVSPETRARLERLHHATGAATIEEVVRRSVRIYELCLEAREAGGRIQAQRPDAPPVDLWLIE